MARAINAGDAMCALSFLSLEHAAAHLDARRVLQMLALLHEAHAVMCEGQSLDLYFESERSVDLADYYRMIECKTAQLFDASCRLGAHAAGCDEATIAGYGAVGRAYGMAFQIRDDVAGIWSIGRRDRERPSRATSRAENGPFRSSGRSRSRLGGTHGRRRRLRARRFARRCDR